MNACKQQLLRYWLAMNATALDSAVHAVALFCGVAGAHEITATVPALNLPQLAWLFLIAFGRALLAYLDAHPLAGVTSPNWNRDVPTSPEEISRGNSRVELLNHNARICPDAATVSPSPGGEGRGEGELCSNHLTSVVHGQGDLQMPSASATPPAESNP